MADLLYLMGFLSEDPPPLGPHKYDPDKLHVTFMNYGAIPDSSMYDFVRALGSVLRWHSPIPVRTAEDMLWFGEFAHIPVRAVHDIGNKFSLLHHDAVSALEDNGGKHVTEHKSYCPHVSYVEKAGHQGVISHLSLVHHRGGFGVDVNTIHNFRLR